MTALGGGSRSSKKSILETQQDLTLDEDEIRHAPTGEVLTAARVHRMWPNAAPARKRVAAIDWRPVVAQH
jgi:hypothetical protein